MSSYSNVDAANFGVKFLDSIKKTLNSSNLNIEKFEEFYSNCFDSKHATPIPKHGIIELEVLKRIDD